MPLTREFAIPEGMKPKDVAQTFTAYLVGGRTFNDWMDRALGPFRKDPKRDDRWQLDTSNDFWLHVEGTIGQLNCRYDDHQPVLDAMLTLYELRILNKTGA